MASIRTKIQSAFYVNFGAAIIFIISVAVIALIILNKNQAIVDRMVQEYSLITTSEQLIFTYNSLSKNPNDPNLNSEFESQKQHLIQTVSLLETSVPTQSGKNLLMGVKNTVTKMVDQTNSGINDIKSQIYTTTYEHFVQARKYNDFVKSNTADLILNELEYLANSQKTLKNTYYLVIGIFVAIFLIFFIIILSASSSLIKKIIKPLIALTESAKKIASGDMAAGQNLPQTNSNDEVHSLTQSIQTMIQTLIGTLDELKTTNSDLESTKTKLESQNEELSKTNQLMINRELKMIEMKKELTSLQEKIAQLK